MGMCAGHGDVCTASQPWVREAPALGRLAGTSTQRAHLVLLYTSVGSLNAGVLQASPSKKGALLPWDQLLHSFWQIIPGST